MKIFKKIKNIFIRNKDKKNPNILIEKLFNEGQIVLPTDKRDYLDLEEFIIKTKNNEIIQKKLINLGFENEK